MSERAQSENKVIARATGEQCDKPEADNINNVSNDKKKFHIKGRIFLQVKNSTGTTIKVKGTVKPVNDEY